MTRINIGICAILVLLYLTSFALVPELMQIKSRIQEEAEISNAELTKLNDELAEYQKLEGNGAKLGIVIRTAQLNHCKGQCLRQVVQSMNLALQEGDTMEMAQYLVTDAIHAVAPKWVGKSENQKADILQQRVRKQIYLRTVLTEQDKMRLPMDPLPPPPFTPMNEKQNKSEKQAVKKPAQN